MSSSVLQRHDCTSISSSSDCADENQLKKRGLLFTLRPKEVSRECPKLPTWNCLARVYQLYEHLIIIETNPPVVSKLLEKSSRGGFYMSDQKYYMSMLFKNPFAKHSVRKIFLSYIFLSETNSKSFLICTGFFVHSLNLLERLTHHCVWYAVIIPLHIRFLFSVTSKTMKVTSQDSVIQTFTSYSVQTVPGSKTFLRNSHHHLISFTITDSEKAETFLSTSWNSFAL